MIFSTWKNNFLTSFSKQESCQYFIARPANSAAGSGIFLFSQDKIYESLEKINKFAPNDWLIEQYFENCRSLNIQLFIKGPFKIEFLGLSEQIFKGFLYQGNSGSKLSTDEVGITECLNQSEIIANDISNSGYTGLIGLDFIITPTGSVKAIENNIRINGSTFSLALIALIEKNINEELYWRFEKISLDWCLSFEKTKKLLSDFMMDIKSLSGYGLFIQEFTLGLNKTEFAFIMWAKNQVGLEDLKKTVVKLLMATQTQAEECK